jgi:hypothetical protein
MIDRLCAAVKGSEDRSYLRRILRGFTTTKFLSQQPISSTLFEIVAAVVASWALAALGSRPVGMCSSWVRRSLACAVVKVSFQFGGIGGGFQTRFQS